MSTLLQDLRYAIRQLRKSPGFTLLVILTLALGIGANTAVFSVVNGFVRPLPVKAPDQIAAVVAQVGDDNLGFQRRFSYAALVDLRKQADSFSDLFGRDRQLGGLSTGGKASTFAYDVVTGNFFSALGLQPASGRLLKPDEGEQTGAQPVLVLGYAYWQKRFGGDPAVIGQQVRVDGLPVTIIGVAPKGFRGLTESMQMDGYLPLNFLTLLDNRGFSRLFEDRNMRRLEVYGRLKSGMSVRQAQSSMNVIARRLARQYPATDKDISVRVLPERFARPFPVPLLADTIPLIASLFLVLGALVLLVACMNVANILLVRGTLRRREMAIRIALGSGRRRLLRQMLTESVLLALLGGVAGVLLGMWASDALSSIRLETSLPLRIDFSFDWRVFAYALAAATCTGIIIGIWPAFRGSRGDINMVLHEGGRSDSSGAGRHGMRNALVVAQVAGSLTLLIVAGLFVRQLQQAQHIDLGFDPNDVLNAAIDPHQVGYDQPRAKEFYRQLESRVRALPGVRSASLAFSVPMGYWDDGSAVYVEGHALAAGQQPPVVSCNTVDPGYFETMRVPLLRGRAFRESDNETGPLVAIVNETMANRFWPHQDPIGKRFSTKGDRGPFAEVVGVARDGKYVVLFESPLPHFYLPFAQNYGSMRVLQVRSSLPSDTLASEVQRQVQALDPEMPITDLRTMRQSLAGGKGFLMYRVGASMAAAMGMLGLVLAVVGVYGVVSFSASQRTREIGIRMALGADTRDVRRLVLRQGVRLVVFGVAAGLVAAFALTRLMSSFLAFVSSTDPVTFAAVTLLLVSVALWACYLPARRAMRVDPMVALRHE